MGIIPKIKLITRIFTMNPSITLACFSTVLLCGCANSFLKPIEGSERVLLLNANQVTHCQSLGKISVNVVTKVGIYTREANTVEANLLQLGQNNAIEMGGDSLVKDTTPEFGKQVFAVYKCKR